MGSRIQDKKSARARCTDLSGTGVSERDEMIGQYARAAGIAQSDAVLICEGREDEVSNAKNVESFRAAVGQHFGYGGQDPVSNFVAQLPAEEAALTV